MAGKSTPTSFDWICLGVILLAMPLSAIVQTVYYWTGSQFMPLYWLQALITDGLILVGGLSALVFPLQVINWYNRLDKYLTERVVIHQVRLFHALRPALRIDASDASAIQLLGVMVTVLGLALLSSVVYDINQRPECLWMACSLGDH